MKHRHYTSIEFICARCCNTNDLTIEVESPSDYYLLDNSCPHCGEALPDNINDEVYKAVVNYFAGAADFEA